MRLVEVVHRRIHLLLDQVGRSRRKVRAVVVLVVGSKPEGLGCVRAFLVALPVALEEAQDLDHLEQ